METSCMPEHGKLNVYRLICVANRHEIGDYTHGQRNGIEDVPAAIYK